ncbi:uncharacterized protein I303_100399 [Kwoniella dejecticola CBS 10117]|uniref:Uncharacterized protein n=1 Tax=Kwoniella dejecticola CBS 10117 TaxID=1296121 RepID=A0A1A6AEU5_9TREE|nr:uncharacterized protein I303_00398 [Kwoniella dejecticola CBS 10117]OBR88581.1 hypothetical protein I303_00398 [Kwoniella dejecticola CBS 10117]
MVLGILSAVAACPAIIGTTEAVRHGQKAQAKEAHRGQKVNMIVKLPTPIPGYTENFEGALIVLKDNKVYIQHAQSTFPADSVHPFAGYYLPYPSNQNKWAGAGYKGEGLVSTINDANQLNWIYVDRDTHELKYGVKADVEAHCAGPWDCTAVDKRMTFEGWEGFIAVQVDAKEDIWALYFDRFDDGLSSNGLIGDFEETGKQVRMLEVQLVRKERMKGFDMACEERVERIRAMRGKQKEEQEAGLQGSEGE